MRRYVSRAVTTVIAIVVAVGLGSSAATAVSSPDVETASTPGDLQDRFSGLGYEALQQFPDDVVDFLWLGEHGQIIVTPESFDAVSKRFDDPSVEVVASRVASVSYLDRAGIELEAMSLFKGVPSLNSGARYGCDPVWWTPRKRECSSWEARVGSSLLSTRTRP